MIDLATTVPLAAIGFTTYKKPEAAKRLLQTLIEHGYAEDCQFFFADDFGAQIIEELGYSALDVYNEFKDLCHLTFLHGSKERGGVSRNKNRLIWYFLNKCTTPYLLLLDDDIQFIAPGLIEELIKVLRINKIQHCTGQWEDPPGRDPIPGATGNLWHTDFPVEAMGEYAVTWHNLGCHGCADFFTREILEKVGYYDVFKDSFYGFDHSIFGSRCLRAYGRSPMWYPQHSRAWKYYHGQNIPNRYGGTEEDIKKADPQFWALLQKTIEGVHINVKNPGFDPKDLRIYE